jgi:hypothetical protein
VVATTHSAVAVPGFLPDALDWREWLGELWWIPAFADWLLLTLLRLLWARARKLPPSAIGPLACVALCGYMGYRGVSGYLADPRPIMAVLAFPIIAVLGFLLFVSWVMSGLAPITYRSAHGSMTMRRTITGKTEMIARFTAPPGKHRTTKRTALHEGAHAAATEACGGKIVAARAFDGGGGWLKARLPKAGSLKDRVINYISVLVAGELSDGHKGFSEHDQHWAKWARDKLPRSERIGAWSRAYAKARRAQRTHAGVANRVATSLLRTGWYHGVGGPERYLGTEDPKS